MDIGADAVRFDLGLHGLALLRTWPFGDAEAAEERMALMRRLLTRKAHPDAPELRDVAVLDVDGAYADWAERYDEPNPLIVAEESVLGGVLDRFPPGAAIDVAAGTGRVAEHLVDRGHSVIAIDRSEAMLRRAVERGIPSRICGGDLRQLPVAEATADLLTCALALTHLVDLRPALSEFARVVRPGGAIVTSDIHPFAVFTGGHAFFRRADGSHAVTRNELHWPSAYVDAAAAAGLVVERCQEAFIDQALVDAFAADDAFVSSESAGAGLPETAILGLPFVLMWVFRRPDGRRVGEFP
jgi:ubiquinone/menaquinone biosynthesis C-methylase UbiE